MQANAEETLHAAFLPFTLGEHVCTIVFEDSACGKFVYEITGDTTLPAAFNKFKFQVSRHPLNSFFDICRVLQHVCVTLGAASNCCMLAWQLQQ